MGRTMSSTTQRRRDLEAEHGVQIFVIQIKAEVLNKQSGKAFPHYITI